MQKEAARLVETFQPMQVVCALCAMDHFMELYLVRNSALLDLMLNSFALKIMVYLSLECTTLHQIFLTSAKKI